jgi:transcriptional regulator with GAF, ATPase, and Fis domain
LLDSKQLILRVLEETNGSYTEAAKRLGIHPTNLHRLIRALGLRGDQRLSQTGLQDYSG